MVIAHINPPWSFCFVVITIIPWIYMGFNLLFYVALDSITHHIYKLGLYIVLILKNKKER